MYHLLISLISLYVIFFDNVAANSYQVNRTEDLILNKQVMDSFNSQFYKLSPRHNPRRGYDTYGLLPAYKIRFASGHGSFYYPWKLIENNNEELSTYEKQRLERYVPKTFFLAGSFSLTQALAYTEDLVEEQHDGTGEVVIKLNKYLERFEYYKDAENVYSSGKKTGVRPPMLIVEGTNWWIEFDHSWISDMIDFFQKLHQQDPITSKWMEATIAKSPNNTVVQRFHLTSPQKERITFDFCSAICPPGQSRIWTVSWWINRKEDAPCSERYVKINKYHASDFFQYYLLSFQDAEHSNEEKIQLGTEHLISTVNNIPLLYFHSKGWEIDVNKAYWTSSHSYIEEVNAKRVYTQEIELTSPQKEKIKIKIILAFEDDEGRLYRLYWTPLT